MKILRIINTMNPESGGPCQGIRNFIPELENLGVQTEVVCMDEAQESFLIKDKFIIHALGKGKSRWNFNSLLIPWLKENLSRFDIVISDGLWLFPSYAMLTALRFLKSKKNVNVPAAYIMPHGMLDPYFQKAKERKWKALRNWIYWNLIEGKVVNECDGVLFTCEAELLLARGTFRSYRPKLEINVGYGIQNAPIFVKSMQSTFEEKCPDVIGQKYFLFLSRIAKKKGIDILIKAYESLVKEGVILPKLVIAGPGKESAFGTQIVYSVLSNPILSDKVFFPGMLSNDSKWGAFYGCEAFILPSHQENFGIAVAEALACGKPVLISKQVNIWGKIEEEYAGIIGQDTERGVREMLKRWLNIPLSTKELMGLNAKKSHNKHFEVKLAAKIFFNELTTHHGPMYRAKII